MPITGFDLDNQKIQQAIAHNLKLIAEELHRLRLLKERESGYSSEDKIENELGDDQ